MNEKITIAIVDLSGSPKSGATVELRFGASVYAGTELGASGNYHWSSIPLGKYFLWVNGSDTGESFAVGEGELARLGYDDGKVLKSTASSIIWSDGFVEKTGSVMSGALYNTDKIIAGWNGNTSAYTDYTLLDGNGFAHYKFSDLIGTSEANGQYRADSINLFSSLGTATSFNVQVDTDSHSSASTDLANAVGHASTFLNNQATYDLFKQAAYSIWSDDAGGYAWFGSPYADSSPFSAKQFMFATDGTNSVEFFTNDLRFNGQSIFESIPSKSIGKHGVVRTSSGGFFGSWSINTANGQLSLSTANDYYLQGVKNTISSGVVLTLPTSVPVVNFPNPYHYGAMWIVYVDSDNIVKYSMTWPDILQVVLLARVYVAYNSGATAIESAWIYEERHSADYGGYEHFVDHFGIGAHIVGSDPILAGYQIQPSSPIDADNSYSVTGLVVADEDVALSVSAIAEGNAKPVVYKDTWRWVEVSGNTLGYLYQSGGRIQYNFLPNQHGSLQQVPSGSFVNYYQVCFTRTDGTKRLMLMAGSGYFADAVSAAAADLLTDLYLSDLDAYETVVLYRITYGVSDSYGTTGRCRIEAINYIKEGRGTYRGTSSVLNANLQNLNVSNNTNLNGSVGINATMNINGQTTLSPTTKIGGSILGSVVVVTDASGNLTVANSISVTELGYLDGVTSSIQAQLNAKANSADVLDKSATEQEKAGILGVTAGLRIKQSSDLSQLLFGHTLENKSDWKFLLESNQTGTNNWVGLRVRQDAGATDYPIRIQRVTGGAIEFYRPVEAYNSDFLVTHDSTKKSILQVTSGDTTVQRSAQIIKHKTSALAGNGLGVILEALGEDSGASEFKIGAIDFVRTTANGTGDMYLQSSLSGAYQNVLRLRSDKISEFYGTLILNSAGYSTSQYLKTDASKQVVSQNGIPWGDLTGVPSTFTPSAHTHAWSDITSGIPTTLAGYGITDAVALGANNAFTGINTFTSATTAPIQSVRSGAVSTTPLVLQTFTLATTATGVSDYFGPELLFYGSLNGTYKSYAKIGGHRYNSDNTGGLSIYTSDGSTWQRGITQTHLGKILLPVSTVTRAGLSIGAFGVGPSSPEDGDIWKSSADTLQIRMSTNTRTIPFLQTAQTWSAVQTFSSTPVISSTTASMTTGAVYRVANRGMADYELLARLSAYTVFKASGGTTVSNSTTETSLSTTATFGTATLPANFMQLSTLIRVTVPFAYTNTNGRLLTLKLKLGGTTIASCQFTQATTATQYESITFQAYATLAPAASVPVIGAISHMSPTLPIVVASSTGTSTTLATNGSLAVTVTAQWNTADATSTFAGYISTIEVV